MNHKKLTAEQQMENDIAAGKYSLTQEEQKISDDLAVGKYRSLPKSKWKHYQQAASNTLKKIKKEDRISLRIQKDDLNSIKRIAERDGLPYQTLIGSILHRFVSGRFTERHA